MAHCLSIWRKCYFKCFFLRQFVPVSLIIMIARRKHIAMETFPMNKYKLLKGALVIPNFLAMWY